MTDHAVDHTVARIARLLSVGTLLSVVVVAAASLLNAAAGRTPLETPGPDLDAGGLATDVLALRPEGLLWLGLLLIVALPTTRVALALVGFARAGDRHASAVAAAVLGVLASSVAAALATRG